MRSVMGFLAKLGLTLAASVAAALALVGYRHRSARQQEIRQRRARQEFLLRREWLEARFLQMASARGLPRGLAWTDCDFDSPVSFARDRKTGELTALVAVTIRFEAIESGGMEAVEAVAEAKAATAVFRYDGQQWTTGGRAIFNPNPVEAIQFYQSELETVD